MEEALLDDIIKRLLDSKTGKVPKQVQLNEPEIRQLCAAAKDIFLSQPNLLELEAPIKICGISYFLFPFFFNFNSYMSSVWYMCIDVLNVVPIRTKLVICAYI